VEEKEAMKTLLGDAGIDCTEQGYFAGEPPSLLQHFETIAEMKPTFS
jgi:hypothetical protein